MATRKKKTEELVNVPSNGWPKMNQGTHLTVKTFEDGHTELVWDDEQLSKEVREAIASVENKVLNSVELSMETIEKAKTTSKKGKKK